jgi:hypothetical protein
MTDTANLGLPCIDAAQAQKHVTHNEALRLLDTLVQLAVLDRDLTAPPGSPSEGQRWIVKAGATGAWVGYDADVAAWQDGGWQFSTPKMGWVAYVVDEGALVAWNGSAWVDALSMLTSLQNLTLLGIGTTADSTNPFSAKLNNALWTAKTVAEGGTGDLRYKLSKATAANTLSMLLQDNFSGRAEIGLTGDDDFHFKVSPDGSTWAEALTISSATGGVRFLAVESDVASAATCDIGSAASLKVQITGTTTITSFGTVHHCLRLLRFAGALTLTNNATSLVLPTGANIVTAAGDCAIATSDASGNWRVREYQRADGTPLAGGGLSADAVTASMVAASSHGYALPMFNGTIVESHASNAVTFSVKTLAGANPSSSDPVDFFFRDATAATGDYVRRRVTAALSVTVASTKTLGTSSATPFKIWLLAVDTGSGVELGVVNCWDGSALFPLNEDRFVSPTATPGNSAGVIYTTSGQTSKPFRKIGHASYETGLTTAGTWDASPTKLQLYGLGIASPGDCVQLAISQDGAVAQGTTAVPDDDTIPQNTEGTQFQSRAIVPTSAANILKITSQALLCDATVPKALQYALFQDSTANALKAVQITATTANKLNAVQVQHIMLAGTASSTTFKTRAGDNAGNTIGFNGFPSTPTREFGGVSNSFIEIEEIAT